MNRLWQNIQAAHHILWKSRHQVQRRAAKTHRRHKMEEQQKEAEIATADKAQLKRKMQRTLSGMSESEREDNFSPAHRILCRLMFRSFGLGGSGCSVVSWNVCTHMGLDWFKLILTDIGDPSASKWNLRLWRGLSPPWARVTQIEIFRACGIFAAPSVDFSLLGRLWPPPCIDSDRCFLVFWGLASSMCTFRLRGRLWPPLAWTDSDRCFRSKVQGRFSSMHGFNVSGGPREVRFCQVCILLYESAKRKSGWRFTARCHTS